MTRALASRLLALLLVFGGLAFQAPVAHAADADPFTIAPTTLTFPATAVGETSAGIAVTVTNAWGISQTLTTVAGGVPFRRRELLHGPKLRRRHPRPRSILRLYVHVHPDHQRTADHHDELLDQRSALRNHHPQRHRHPRLHHFTYHDHLPHNRGR